MVILRRPHELPAYPASLAFACPTFYLLILHLFFLVPLVIVCVPILPPSPAPAPPFTHPYRIMFLLEPLVFVAMHPSDYRSMR